MLWESSQQRRTNIKTTCHETYMKMAGYFCKTLALLARLQCLCTCIQQVGYWKINTMAAFQVKSPMVQKRYGCCFHVHQLYNHHTPFQKSDRSRSRSPLSSMNKDINIDGVEDEYENYQPTNLDQFIKNQFKSKTTSSLYNNHLDTARDHQQHKQQQRYDPLMGYTLEDLESFAVSQQQRDITAATDVAHHSKIPKYIDNSPSGSVPDEEGILLDPNEYIQSSRRDYQNTMDDTTSNRNNEFANDGNYRGAVVDKSTTEQQSFTDPKYSASIRGYLETLSYEPNTNSPSYTDKATSVAKTTTPKGTVVVGQPHNDDTEALDELWAIISKLQSHDSSTTTTSDAAASEELHRQVFKNEIGFYNQSELFLQSLTNTTKAAEANVVRRGRYYRDRQQEAIQALNEQMDEFEAVFLLQQQQQQQQQQGNNTNNSTELLVQCGQCRCRLSEEEIEYTASQTKNQTNEPICRVCHMEQLVSRNRYNNDITRYDEQSTRPARIYRPAGGDVNNVNGRYVSPRNSIQRKVSVGIGGQQLSVPRTTMLNDPVQPSLRVDTLEVIEEQDESVRDQSASDVNNILIDEGIDMRPQAQHEMKSIYPWVEVMDPDTEEIFYWNEETEEMRWELDV
jgi:hypothetical protein